MIAFRIENFKICIIKVLRFPLQVTSNTSCQILASGWLPHTSYQSLYSSCELRRITKYCMLFLFVFRIETVGKIFNKISSLNCLLKTFQSSPHDKLRDCPEPTGRWKFKNLNHYKYNQLASVLPPHSYGNLLVLKHFQVILGFAA